MSEPTIAVPRQNGVPEIPPHVLIAYNRETGEFGTKVVGSIPSGPLITQLEIMKADAVEAIRNAQKKAQRGAGVCLPDGSIP